MENIENREEKHWVQNVGSKLQYVYKKIGFYTYRTFPHGICGVYTPIIRTLSTRSSDNRCINKGYLSLSPYPQPLLLLLLLI